MSRGGDTTYMFPYSKNQHLHTSVCPQYTQQQNQYPPQNNIIAQTPSGTPNPQYTNTSIMQPTLTQTRRYNSLPQLHTSIAPQTPTAQRQFSSTQHPSIAPQLNEHPPSPAQSLQTNNSVSPSSSISSSLPTSLPTPPNVPAGLTSPNSGTTAASKFDLQEICKQFSSKPEILKIILISKVEEDKRKAAEAKLRLRELDLILYERDRCGKNIDHVDESKNDDIHSNHDIDYENDNSIGQLSTSDGSANYASVQNPSLNSSSTTPVSSTSQHNSTSDQMTSHNQSSQIQTDQNGQGTTESESNIDGTPNKRKRKRREMQPVTMIADAKQFPCTDNYLWKNNGNTTQRKTGRKSVYYKCSNSNKGCPVNKTVSEKEDGWTVKYRGNHLEICGKIQRVDLR